MSKSQVELDVSCMFRAALHEAEVVDLFHFSAGEVLLCSMTKTQLRCSSKPLDGSQSLKGKQRRHSL